MKLRFNRFLSTLLCAALLSGCAPGTRTPERTTLQGRPGPVYVQWLEEQAFLRQAPELTGIVSGSMLSWKHSSRQDLPSDRKGAWFCASPTLSAWSGKRPFTAALAEKGIAERLAGIGVSGVVLTGMTDTGDEWAGRSPAAGLGRDDTSLTFGRLAGKDDDYAAWTGALARTGLMAGGEMLPSFTGTGPDFFLSLRAVRDYPGLYAMTEVSPKLWPLLPPLKEKGTAPLGKAALAALTAQGALPEALAQDEAPSDLLPGGWAVTGPVSGVDGVKRRWAYRWHQQPDRPVLHWDDPSGTARRVMEASLIQQSGLRHQALVGIRAGAWLGLDAVDKMQGCSLPTLEPGLSALRDLSRNAHRYGSALFVQDIIPPELLASLLNCGADFFFDSVLSPALEIALLTQDASPVQESLRRAASLNIDQRRLWRLSPDGLPRPDFSPLLSLVPEGWSRLLVRKKQPDEGPRINAVTLSAMACGLAPDEIPDAETALAMRETHELSLAARAFLPGLFMFSGTDLDGSLPEGSDWPATPPLWQLDRMPASPQGLPSGRAVYAGLPGNDMEHRLRAMLTARAASGIAEGTLVDVPSCAGKSVLITVCSLPDGGFLAFFGNLSRKEETFTPSFPAWQDAAERIDLLSGRSAPEERMTLPPRGWRALRLR